MGKALAYRRIQCALEQHLVTLRQRDEALGKDDYNFAIGAEYKRGQPLGL